LQRLPFVQMLRNSHFHVLLLLWIPCLHKSHEFNPSSHICLHCSVQGLEKWYSFVEEFFHEFKMTFLDPNKSLKCAFENLKWGFHWDVTLLPWIPSIFFMIFTNSYGWQFPNEEWLPKIKSCKETYFPPKKPNLFPHPFQCFTCEKIMFYCF